MREELLEVVLRESIKYAEVDSSRDVFEVFQVLFSSFVALLAVVVELQHRRHVARAALVLAISKTAVGMAHLNRLFVFVLELLQFDVHLTGVLLELVDLLFFFWFFAHAVLIG